MLVLSRKSQESITLFDEDGRPVIVHVVAVKGSSVRLGIAARKGVEILRTELVAPEPAVAS